MLEAALHESFPFAYFLDRYHYFIHFAPCFYAEFKSERRLYEDIKVAEEDAWMPRS